VECCCCCDGGGGGGGGGIDGWFKLAHQGRV